MKPKVKARKLLLEFLPSALMMLKKEPTIANEEELHLMTLESMQWFFWSLRHFDIIDIKVNPDSSHTLIICHECAIESESVSAVLPSISPLLSIYFGRCWNFFCNLVVDFFLDLSPCHVLIICHCHKGAIVSQVLPSISPLLSIFLCIYFEHLFRP